MTVKPTKKKIDKTTSACPALTDNPRCTIRILASTIGLLVSCFPGVMYGPLFCRALEYDKQSALKSSLEIFDKFTMISSVEISELHWWAENIHPSYNLITHKNPDFEMQQMRLA